MKFLCNDPTMKERRRELRRNQTDAERVLWERLRSKQFYGLKFYRQYGFGPYVLDFYCPALKRAVELDGGQHAEEDAKIYDAQRTDFLRNHGIYVVRFWNNEVLSNVDGVLERLTPPSLPLR